MKRQNGFTLLEVLVAMAVFVLMTSMAYAGLDAVLDHGTRVDERATQLRQVQRVMRLIGDDLAQALRRPVRDELGDPRPSLLGGAGSDMLLELTRAVLPLDEEDIGLLRVGYRWQDGQLQRSLWHRLDRASDTSPRTHDFELDVSRIEMRFFSGQRWSNSWPPAAQQGAGLQLPLLVEVRLNSGEREYLRVFEPGAGR